MNDVIDCLIHGIHFGEKYPPSVRAFCISLHSISPKAYVYVREKFGKHIPHPETIREWYRNSNLDASSGISQHSMNALEKMAQDMANAQPAQQLVVALLMDEMAIKRSMMWDRATNKFIGVTDCGVPSNDEFTLADNVIVFMVSGLNVYFQQPVAYYFIKTLKAPDRADLVLKIIAELSKRGVKVKVLVFDGYSSNALMCSTLGADFKAQDHNYVTSFEIPHDKSKLYIMYDPSHMEKLVRNTLGNIQTIFADGQKIEWKYFVDLVNCSRQKNLGLGHKMNKRHIEWKYRKMHVRTAIETLSGSTANCMEFLKENGVPEFVGASASIKFVRTFNTLWDIMNTCRVNSKDVYKSALNESNKDEIFVFLNEAKAYILSLKIKHPKTGKMVQIVKSIHKTGFRGFLIDIISLEGLYFEVIEEHHWLNFFATYRISQDHLEMLFGKIRAMNGNNDNPMAHQFSSAYRKILHQCDITPSPYSNVKALAKTNTTLISSDILTVPSFRKLRSNLKEDVQLYNKLSTQHNLQLSVDTPPEESSELFNWELLTQRDSLTDNTQDAGLVYMAECIEMKLLDCDQIYCESCVDILRDGKKIGNQMCIGTKSRKPCNSTYKICKLTDMAVNLYINSGVQIKQKIYMEVLNGLEWNNIFPEFDLYEHDIEHKYFLIKFIIDEYVNKKCAYYAKQTMLDSEKKYVRNKLRKLCHFQHQ